MPDTSGENRESVLAYYCWENVGLLIDSLINDLTHPSQNSRVFRLKDFVWKKTNAVFLFACLFVCFFSYIM